MLTAVEATIETDGQVHLRAPIRVTHSCRAIVTIMDEPDVPETALLSEQALARD